MPRWLTLGSILSGPDAILHSLARFLVGGLLLLPCILCGGFGPADALLLAAILTW